MMTVFLIFLTLTGRVEAREKSKPFLVEVASKETSKESDQRTGDYGLNVPKTSETAPETAAKISDTAYETVTETSETIAIAKNTETAENLKNSGNPETSDSTEITESTETAENTEAVTKTTVGKFRRRPYGFSNSKYNQEGFQKPKYVSGGGC